MAGAELAVREDIRGWREQIWGSGADLGMAGAHLGVAGVRLVVRERIWGCREQIRAVVGGSSNSFPRPVSGAFLVWVPVAFCDKGRQTLSSGQIELFADL